MPKMNYPTDSDGMKIDIDLEVAFNKSGMVTRGIVVSIKPRTDSIARNNKNINALQWVIGIERNGEFSTVKNTDGILVLY